MITRLLQDHISRYLQHFPAIAILGSRQVGKTTLAKQLAQHSEKKCHYLDLELPGDLAKLSNPELYFQSHQADTVILDEIQRTPELFPLLRAIIDQNRTNGRFILLGSASPELLKKSSESLTGRIIFKELTPLHYREVQDSIAQNEHWFYGGYPTPLLMGSDDIRKEWYRAYIRSYVESEPAMMGYKFDSLLLNRFISMIAMNQGGLLNVATYSRALGCPVMMINSYLSFLENAFLVRRLQPYFVNTKKRLVRSPKLYLRDNGLMHYQAGINTFDQLLGNQLIGASWESYVIEQITANFGDQYSYYFYRTQDGTEVDLVMEKSGKPVCCVEIKLTSSPGKSKGLTTAIQDLKTEKNFIIIPGSGESYPLTYNIEVSGLQGFLNKTEI